MIVNQAFKTNQIVFSLKLKRFQLHTTLFASKSRVIAHEIREIKKIPIKSISAEKYFNKVR
jgi:hypothetical protein